MRKGEEKETVPMGMAEVQYRRKAVASVEGVG